MRISPINFEINGHSDKVNFGINGPSDKSCVARDYVPTTVRHNSLSDMDFNIIADTIRSQNLKNQMNVRLMSLRRTLNSTMAQNMYNA